MATLQRIKTVRSVLAVGAVSDAFRDAFDPEVEFVTVPTTDAATELLARRAFDVVLSSGEQFPAQRPDPAAHEAEQILEIAGQGVCTVDRHGNLIWSNPKFRGYSVQTVEAIRQAVTAMCFELAETHRDPQRPPQAHRSVSTSADLHYDVSATPILDDQGEVVRVVALVWDATSSRRLQAKLNAIDAAGRELVRLDAAAAANLDVNERLAMLEEKIISYSRELMQFSHFAVRILHKKTYRLEVLIAEGMPVEAQRLQLYATTDGNGISGYVAATGRSYICPDVPRDPRFLTGIENARSSLTVPLWLHDEIVGILNVESDQVAAFGEDDRQFAEIFGRYIAIALHTLRLLATERSTTKGQLATDVLGELNTPLNEIVTQASTLMEDYIGYDDLRERLHAIIDSVDGVKKRIQHVSSDTEPLLDEAPAKDPLLVDKRVLIADDEDVIRETIADVLTSAGAITVSAQDGMEAIAMIRSQHFDLVVSDINMPRKTGYEVFAAAKEINPDCQVILVTGFGYDPDHSIVKASREGLAGVLFKPFKVDKLLEEIHRALGADPAGDGD
jgi:two-component system, sensor histidine kinase SagS